MKFIISLLAAAAVVHAATPVIRQSSPSASVRAAIQSVIDDANKLTTDVNALTGVDGVAGVQADINQLESDINSGASLFATLPMLSDTDTLALANLVTPLQNSTSNAVDAVIAKKSLIVSLCFGPLAYNTFNTLIPEAQTFATNLRALVPDLYKSIIDSASNNIQASLNRGLSAFSDSQTLPASCTSSSTTTTTTTTTTTSRTTTTTTTTSTTTKTSTTTTTTPTTTTPTTTTTKTSTTTTATPTSTTTKTSTTTTTSTTTKTTTVSVCPTTSVCSCPGSTTKPTTTYTTTTTTTSAKPTTVTTHTTTTTTHTTTVTHSTTKYYPPVYTTAPPVYYTTTRKHHGYWPWPF